MLYAPELGAICRRWEHCQNSGSLRLRGSDLGRGFRRWQSAICVHPYEPGLVNGGHLLRPVLQLQDSLLSTVMLKAGIIASMASVIPTIRKDEHETISMDESLIYFRRPESQATLHCIYDCAHPKALEQHPSYQLIKSRYICYYKRQILHDCATVS
ncbi:hypothetical protein BDW60DRAFT_167406 [Aspergillus nidulans var. acristatus]|jgi:hypothetical protein